MSDSLSVSGSNAYIGTGKLSTSSVIMGKDASQLGMSDFFNLLAAQMQNQDIMNPQDNTEFIAQMAQFTTLQGIQTIQEYQLSSYATSYVGKTVAIAYTGESGNLIKTEGVVERVTFYDGEPKVIVDNMAYPLYAVMEVKMPGSSSTTSGGPSFSEAGAYIGKIAKVEYTREDETGENEKVTAEGVVTSVTVKNAVTYVVIDGEEYPAYAVVSIKEATGGEDGE